MICEAVGKQKHYERTSNRAADLTDVLIASVVLAEALLERNGDLRHSAGVNAFSRLRLGREALQAILSHTEHTSGSLRDALAG